MTDDETTQPDDGGDDQPDQDQPDQDQPEQDQPGEGHLGELIAQRREKLEAWRGDGVDPYPVGVEVTHQVADVVEAWADRLEDGEETDEIVTISGRIMMRRGMGKLAFLVLREGGTDLQAMVSKKEVGGAEEMAKVDRLDVGDWIAVTGRIIRSRRGELSVMASSVRLMAKALRPLPDKWHGLSDTDTRYRQRYVDLIVNDSTRRTFEVRTAVMKAFRDELVDRGFIEVETPLLHPIPGGAAARPFITHHNALDLDLYLRIAPELYLKRLIVGGMHKVFELGRTFRNEGLSTRHNPEFTMLETYEAYADHEAVMDMTEALLRRAAQEAIGTTEVTYGDVGMDLGRPFARATVLELVQAAVGRADLSYDTPIADLAALAREHGIDPQEAWGSGKIVFELYEALVEDTIAQPTFVTEHPIETSPLAHAHREKPHVTERFELVIGGREYANGFSELSDPDDQRRRFEAQAAAKAAGDAEAMSVDEDYLRALEYGMPPTGGLGVGVDRFVMLLADVQTIRDVILFPTLRPEAT